MRASMILAFHACAHKFTCLSVVSVSLSVCLSVYVPVCNSMHSQYSSAWPRRGWLSRLEKVSSDKEEFCRLDRLLISVAVEGGNQPGPEQVGYLST
jgi:ribonuclease HI